MDVGALPAGGVRPRRFAVNRFADTPRKDVRLRASPDYFSLVASVYQSQCLINRLDGKLKSLQNEHV